MKNENLIRAIGAIDESFIIRAEKHSISVIDFEEIKARKSRRLIVLLIAVLAAILVGFAFADRIQQFFTQYFGAGGNLRQYSQDIGETSTNQGLRMEVLTALKDGENIYLFVDITDEAANRLEPDLVADHGSMNTVKNLGENVASMSGINCKLINYDVKSKTATLAIHAEGEFDATEAIFQLNSVGIGKKTVDVAATEINLYELVETHPGKFTSIDNILGGVGFLWGREKMEEFHKVSGDLNESLKVVHAARESITEVLSPDAFTLDIPGYPLEHITNIAYHDGNIHIQMKPDSTDYWSVEQTLKDKKTGESLPLLYSIIYGTTDEAELDKYPSYHYEVVYRIGDMENLLNYVLCFEGDYRETVIKGNWEVRFDVPEQMQTQTITAGKPISDSGKSVMVNKISISPLSIVVFTAAELKENMTVCAIYNDSSRIELMLDQSYVHESKEQEWQFIGPFINYENLTFVEINGMRFDLSQR